ncbi:MAG TPA: hypothetical protein VGD87_14415 [Archangium sp.]
MRAPALDQVLERGERHGVHVAAGEGARELRGGLEREPGLARLHGRERDEPGADVGEVRVDDLDARASERGIAAAHQGLRC